MLKQKYSNTLRNIREQGNWSYEYISYYKNGSYYREWEIEVQNDLIIRIINSCWSFYANDVLADPSLRTSAVAYIFKHLFELVYVVQYHCRYGRRTCYCIKGRGYLRNLQKFWKIHFFIFCIKLIFSVCTINISSFWTLDHTFAFSKTPFLNARAAMLWQLLCYTPTYRSFIFCNLKIALFLGIFKFLVVTSVLHRWQHKSDDCPFIFCQKSIDGIMENAFVGYCSLFIPWCICNFVSMCEFSVYVLFWR